MIVVGFGWIRLDFGWIRLDFDWMPLLRMYEVDPELKWEAFRQEYQRELEGWRAECPAKIDEKGLETEIRGGQEDKAGSTDGCRTASLLLPRKSDIEEFRVLGPPTNTQQQF